MEKVFFKPERAGADALALGLFSERLGAEPGSAAFETMKREAEAVVKKLRSAFGAKCEYVGFGEGEFTLSGSRLAAGGVTVECRAFERMEKEAVKNVYFCACTAGDFACASEDDMEKFYADLWGGAYLDGLRTLLEDELADRAAEEGLTLSRSFGPGFYGMDVSETAKIAEIVDFDELGMRINSAGVMEPPKSCAGLYFAVREGFGDPGPECKDCRGNEGGCRFCLVNKKSCD